eukprot:9809524-Heterocapsa_arctica.AAC.1
MVLVNISVMEKYVGMTATSAIRFSPGLYADARILVLELCPRVLSLGRLVTDDQCRSSWVPGRAWITDPQGGEL